MVEVRTYQLTHKVCFTSVRKVLLFERLFDVIWTNIEEMEIAVLGISII